MKQIIILGVISMLTACAGGNSGPDCDPNDGCRRVNGPNAVKVSDNRSCAEKMYDLGEMIRNMHYLGWSRSMAMNELGEAGYQLRDFIGVVWSQPSGYWAKGEIGNQLRAEAIRQGCV